MKNLVGYVRVSDKEQVKGNSLETQEKIITDYALRNDAEIVKVFVEKGESAKTTDRTELKNLLEYVAKNHKNLYGVIVYKVDRLARIAYDHATLKLYFNQRGLKLLSATESLEDTPVGRWVENMLAGTAQFDNEVRTERSVNGMIAAVKGGRYVWGAPVGYINTGGRGTSNLAPDNPETVRLVRKSWEYIDTGYTQEEARKAITKEGLRGKKGTPISKSHFPRMLRNKVYMGVIEKFGLTIVGTGTFKPIVDAELFLRVLDKLDGKTKSIPIYKKDHEDFPVRGLLLCDKCGRKLTASWSKGNGGRFAYYRCIFCKKVNYKRDDDRKGNEGVETKFLKFLKNYHYKQELKEALIKAIELNLEHRNQGNKKRVAEIEKALLALKAKEKQIAEKNFNGVMNDTLAKEMFDENDDEKTALALELHSYQENQEDVMEVARHSISVLEDISGVWMRVNLDIKKRFQKFLFPQGLTFDGQEFATIQLAYCISPKLTNTPQNSLDVSRQGLEP
ncbi:MAG: Site-specific recombinase [Candidatus Gottesmanbacteria bacterium GW2011_GWC2_39_8]|uniref:Site-specific recombinase n=1 Tax=Candidatus Gottesmanbacteria bacterium GW2011_GWC2_39_8 TaxID=1618450 RepID=A0A0G0SCC7_9BACT|nr:MAG: Site-specific recombinase [Candidatus Gottesmanbacteria bacterium GW2011_GWC2_39_8]